jgi:hypothetical protein
MLTCPGRRVCSGLCALAAYQEWQEGEADLAVLVAAGVQDEVVPLIGADIAGPLVMGVARNSAERLGSDVRDVRITALLEDPRTDDDIAVHPAASAASSQLERTPIGGITAHNKFETGCWWGG